MPEFNKIYTTLFYYIPESWHADAYTVVTEDGRINRHPNYAWIRKKQIVDNLFLYSFIYIRRGDSNRSESRNISTVKRSTHPITAANR